MGVKGGCVLIKVGYGLVDFCWGLVMMWLWVLLGWFWCLRHSTPRKLIEKIVEENLIEVSLLQKDEGWILLSGQNTKSTQKQECVQEEKKVDIQKTINELKELKNEYNKVEDKVLDYLKELNYKI